MSEESVHSGHRMRLRTLYDKYGIDALQDHEVLEMLLFYAIPRRDTNGLAHSLLDTFGSLEKVFAAPVGELMKVGGIKENTAILLKFIPDLGMRIERSKQQDIIILKNTAAVGQYLAPYFINKLNEIIMYLALDSKKRIVCCKQIAEGNFNSANVNMRTIISESLRYNASYIIIAHNHPSGTALPSKADINTSKKIYSMCASIGVNFLDHLIYAGDDYISFADSGGMDNFLETYKGFAVCDEDASYE